MNENVYTEIPVSKIVSNKFNMRKPDSFKGKEFNELKASIKEKGVISPVLVRPFKKGYQLVYGERRFVALCEVLAKNGNKNKSIPAIVKDMTNDELFDLMTIENLHRKDITPLEEAESYKKYLEKRGDKALDDLAVRTGINPQRIRRRTKVLDLPEEVLKSWESGDLLFGHLEQLIRLDNHEVVLEWYRKIIKSQEMYLRGYPVSDLKKDIDTMAIALKHAKFDTEPCKACIKNSEVQKTMFGNDLEEVSCLDATCFKKKQGEWLENNWAKTKFYRNYKTIGFLYKDDVTYDDYDFLYPSSTKKLSAGIRQFCVAEKCEHYKTIIRPNLEVVENVVCTGKDPSCRSKVNHYDPDKTDEGTETSSSRNNRDHGEEFREFFFQTELPAKLESIQVEDPKMYHFLLYSFIKIHKYLYGWFAVKMGKTEMQEMEDGTKQYPTYFYYEGSLLDDIKNLDVETTKSLLKEAVISTIMEKEKFSIPERAGVAKYIGVDLSKEWYITSEYLKKKRIAEILEFSDKLKFFEKENVKKYMVKTFGGDDPKRLKKKELIQVYLESGENLVGLVPEEILNE